MTVVNQRELKGFNYFVCDGFRHFKTYNTEIHINTKNAEIYV